MTENLLYFDFYQILLTIVILISGTFICLLVGSKQKNDVVIIICIFLWHTFFSFYYWYYTLHNIADSLLYFSKTSNSILNFSPGTRFTETLTYIVTYFLKSNYLNTTLVFNIFGSLGLVFFYLSLKRFFNVLGNYWIIIIFIPSISFWSSGIGKDSVAFLSVCLFLYSIVESKRFKVSLTSAFLLMFMVRPHIAAVMLVSYVVYFIVNAKSHIIIKLLILPIIFVGIIFALSFVQEYVGLENASLSSIGDYVDKRQSYNLSGGSSLDIASMSYPMQMFTYIFRPLPFEAHSLLALVTSLENTLFLFIFLYLLYRSKFNIKYFIQDKNLWLFIYVFLSCTILSITTANLGIATRQKWMFMPVLIYLLLYVLYTYKINNKNLSK
ncbi:hypothetical protein Q8P09_11485 [Psychrobacter faecalis]|uniref:Glycosyltransferase RgtA/B/C/D-like domain-containing protein n=1 Tax=Psychrobacter faecalis TaxID=180588 RepID=A0ABT9HIW3_9GAMM|nr:hypothetical protein [Psychrobacter faecalis]MDP4545697.1 hypothetical protein [Psychrobacter faecalis]